MRHDSYGAMNAHKLSDTTIQISASSGESPVMVLLTFCGAVEEVSLMLTMKSWIQGRKVA